MIKGYFASRPADRFRNTLGPLEGLFAGDLEERFGLEVLAKGLAAASES